MNIPSYYYSNKWKKARQSETSLNEKIKAHLYEVERQLKTMSPIEKYKAWEKEPYWEISKLICESEGFSYTIK